MDKPGTGSAAARAILRTLLVVLSAACSRPSPSKTVNVEIRNFAFAPQVTTVSRGDTVAFHNYDVVPHTATATAAFDSDSVGANGDWRWVAGDAGSYDYICAYHPTMKGTLIVE